MLMIAAAIGVVAFIVGVFMIRSIGASAVKNPRAAIVASIGLAVVAFLALGVLGYSSNLWKLNGIAIAGIAVVALLFIGLSAYLGVLLGWKWKGILKVVGMFSAMVLVAGLLSMYMTAWDLPQLTAAEQIAEEYGFTVLLPQGWELSDGYWPVTALEDQKALKLDYVKFQLVESAAEGDLDPDDLRAIVGPGKTVFEEVRVPSTAEVTVTQVNGRPALYVEFSATPPEVEKGAKSENGVLFATQVEDDLVVIWNSTAMLWERDMTETPEPFTEEDMVDIVESLERL